MTKNHRWFHDKMGHILAEVEENCVELPATLLRLKPYFAEIAEQARRTDEYKLSRGSTKHLIIVHGRQYNAFVNRLLATWEYFLGMLADKENDELVAINIIHGVPVLLECLEWYELSIKTTQ